MDTKIFSWITLALMGLFSGGLWRLQDADFQCHSIGASFFHCYYTRTTMLVMVGMSFLIFVCAYCAGWFKWTRSIASKEEQ